MKKTRAGLLFAIVVLLLKNIESSRKLSCINMPGTHDSATQFINFGYFLQNQNTSIPQQLKMCYRYFDVRLKVNKNNLLLCHSFGNCNNHC